MELREMRYFLAMSDALNFTRAAEACGVTQPTLTRGIQKLEVALGAPLFVRERGQTHLTALGRLVQPQIEEVVARSTSLRRQATLHRRLQSSELRLGVMCSIGPARFSGFLRGFVAERPGIAITLIDAHADRLGSMLLDGEVEAALMNRPDSANERLDADLLYTERYVVACAPSHPFAARQSIAMRDMDGQTYLSRINCEHRDALGEGLVAAGATLVNACRSEREDWIQSLVAAGMGVCFLPEFSGVMPGLELRPVEDSPVARHVCLVTVAGRRRSPSLGCFIETLRRRPAPIAA